MLPCRNAKALSLGGNSGDLHPSLDAFVAPAIQKTPQHLRISSNFLQGFTIDARNHPADEPASKTHFNYRYERLILNKGSGSSANRSRFSLTRFAIVVVALKAATVRTWLIINPAWPPLMISVFTCSVGKALLSTPNE